jgi:hypothetical protein
MREFLQSNKLREYLAVSEDKKVSQCHKMSGFGKSLKKTS